MYLQILGIFFEHLHSFPPLGDNHQFYHDAAGTKELLSDSLRLLLTDNDDCHHKVLHTELMVAACYYCYHLLTSTHGRLLYDGEMICLAANLLGGCGDTYGDVVTCFISLCLQHKVHEVSHRVLIEMKRRPLPTNIITALGPTLISINISSSSAELLTVVSVIVSD